MTKTKFTISPLELYSTLVLSIIAIFTAIPVTANTSNFGKVELSPGFKSSQGRLTGYTSGSFPLHKMSKRDGEGNACTGFAATTPDHIMVLKEDFSALKLKVNSNGADTTLFILRAKDRTIRCGDDTGKNKDASVNGKSWKAGIYKIWVGNFNKSMRSDYSLEITEN
ncbi:MAG: hypothetical protein QNJ63_21345 [Calothrix sp. MO_192.B10]|nr:hypothetical protein [Calothrix sp. MO_192.B10]